MDFSHFSHTLPWNVHPEINRLPPALGLRQCAAGGDAPGLPGLLPREGGGAPDAVVHGWVQHAGGGEWWWSMVIQHHDDPWWEIYGDPTSMVGYLLIFPGVLINGFMTWNLSSIRYISGRPHLELLHPLDRICKLLPLCLNVQTVSCSDFCTWARLMFQPRERQIHWWAQRSNSSVWTHHRLWSFWATDSKLFARWEAALPLPVSIGFIIMFGCATRQRTLTVAVRGFWTFRVNACFGAWTPRPALAVWQVILHKFAVLAACTLVSRCRKLNRGRI